MGGWSRAQVSQYAMLNKLCKEAWDVIVPTFHAVGTKEDSGDGTDIVPGGTD